nr:ATP-binding protein [Schlegelella koreensis]
MSNALFLYHPRLRDEGVEIENHCVPGTAIALCEPNRLEQVLTNLIGNAIDAMAGAPVKRVTLRASTEPVPASGARQVRIEVADTGCGFSDEVRAQFFEAFFTTKPSGNGLGLGLTISRDIVREFRGEIVATGAPGAGALFIVTLPAAEPSTAPAPLVHEEEVLT